MSLSATLTDPRDFGAYHDGQRDDTRGYLLTAAVLASLGGGTIVMSGKPHFAQSVSLPATVAVFALPGVRATADAGATVALAGPVLSAEATATVFGGAGTWNLSGTVAVPGTGAMVRLGRVVSTGQPSLTLAYGGGYSSLLLTFEGAGDGAGSNVNLYLRCNGDATLGDYAHQAVSSQAGSAEAEEVTTDSQLLLATIPASTALAGSTGTASARIVNPDNTARHKLVLVDSYARYQADGGLARTGGGEWQSTAALAGLTLTASAGNLVAGSVATLYGLT